MAKIYNLRRGARLPDEILEIAKKDGMRSASVEGIGGVKGLNLAYYNPLKKKYEEHRYREFLEVTGLLGNITMKDGKPFLHVHGTFGRRDMTVLGGHVLSATVFPFLEVVITPMRNRAVRKFDNGTGLNHINQEWGKKT